MNALSARNDYSSGVRDAVSVDAPDATDHALGLQLCRAGILSMTRLQLALERGDRRRAMEAIDRLHTFDSEVEQLVDRLSGPASDARMKAIARHLSEEKMELAFESLRWQAGSAVRGWSRGRHSPRICRKMRKGPTMPGRSSPRRAEEGPAPCVSTACARRR